MKKALLSICIFPLSLLAHNIWLDDAQNVIYGHIKASHEDSHAKNRVIPKDELQSFTCQKLSEDAKGCDSIFVELRPSYYTKTPYGTKNSPKNETPMAIKSHKSHESLKRIYTQNGLAPHNKGLEITLQNTLEKLHVGDKLRIIVLENGKAKQGVTVAYDERSIGISDEDGHVNVKIRHAGLQNIQASYSAPGDSITCDEIIFATTLNFEVSE